jgi:rod shape-determining protein MreC
MLNILKFIHKYHLFLLFGVLFTFSVWLSFQFNTYHHTFFIARANAVSASIHRFNLAIEHYLSLQQVNDSLAAQNAYLLSCAPFSLVTDSAGSTIVRDTQFTERFTQIYTFTEARVVRNSVTGSNNILFIDRGSKAGVQPQMGVMNQQGVVGQVVSVSEHYAAVLSQLNRKYKTSAKLKSSGYFGNLVWDGTDPSIASLEEIPKHVSMKKGDTVVTSGFSELYPANLMIGTILSVKLYPDDNFAEINVKLAVDFRKLDYVYVIRNKRREELLQLDSLTSKLSQ